MNFDRLRLRGVAGAHDEFLLAATAQRLKKQAEAHELLSEIYNWFTEGFGTKDLQDAKALLEELE